jgi:hypothetical protein
MQNASVAMLAHHPRNCVRAVHDAREIRVDLTRVAGLPHAPRETIFYAV